MKKTVHIRLLMAMAVIIAMFAATGFSLTLDTSTNEGAELEDLQTIADEVGITLQEAVTRYGWNDDFARTVSEIRVSSPREVATAKITGDDSASVSFSGEIPDFAQTLVDTFETDFPAVTVTTETNMGYTEQEIQNATMAAHYSVYRTKGVLGAGSSFDHDTMQIDIIAQTGGAPTDPTSDSLRVAAEDAVRDATSQGLIDMMSVSVSVVGHQVTFIDSDSKHMGGEILKHHQDDIQCTSGFGVIDSSGTRGVATAGHCEDEDGDEDLYDDGDELDHEDEHIGDYGDFQWHTGPDTMGNDFYAGSSTEVEVTQRPIERVETPMENQWLCRNGARSHKDCQQVHKVSVCADDVCNLAQFDRVRSVGGDSGGPVYLGRGAFGFHQGSRFDFPRRRDVWSRADYIDEALPGLSIATD